MKNVLHKTYYRIGKFFCNICSIFWKIRDKINSPKTDSVLFVAHPDDDTLFFHTFIKEHKPYVCLMTGGWSLKRLISFFKVMRQYGVRYRAYPLGVKDKRTDLLEKHVSDVMSIKQFRNVATHNSTGEYGNEEHIRVHNAVIKVTDKMNMIFCPVNKECVADYPLDDNSINEKLAIFRDLYVTESWVPFDEDAGTPIWVTHEHLVSFFDRSQL